MAKHFGSKVFIENNIVNVELDWDYFEKWGKQGFRNLSRGEIVLKSVEDKFLAKYDIHYVGDRKEGFIGLDGKISLKKGLFSVEPHPYIQRADKSIFFFDFSEKGRQTLDKYGEFRTKYKGVDFHIYVK